MPPSGGLHRKDRRKKACRRAARHGAPLKRRYADAAKATVMAHVWRLVRDGFARCSEADNGVVELTLSSGEIFHLGKTSVTRIL